MTLELWQRQLSEEEGALERHQLLVKVVIKLIVDRGFADGCPPNWEQAETEVLKLEKLEQVVVSRPGVHFYHAGDYLEAFPKGIDHHRRDGHYEGQLEGQEGFYVPQKGPVIIQYNSIQQSKQESTVDDGTELLTPDQLDVKAKDLLMDMSTGCNMAALGLKRRGVSDAQASSATAKASGAPPRASSAPPKSSSVSAQPRSATANDSTPKKTAAGKPADSPEDAKEPSEPSSVEKAKGKRGRPAKDLALVVSEMCSSFGKDDKTNCLFWGSEVDTQVKSIDKTLRLLKNARKDADPGMKKALEAIKVIITTAKAVGVEHEKFQQTFAYQCTLLDLEPKVCKEFRWPGHLLRLKSRSEIRSIADIDSFFQHCSVDALMQQCDDEGQVEEQMLLALSERIAMCLKAPTSQEAMQGLRNLFNFKRQFAFTESITEFCFALVICGHYENIKDLRDRTRMLSDALDVINTCIPDHRKGIEGNLLGSALTSFGHAGKLFLTMAEEHKGKALLTQELVLSVQEKLDKWAAAVASVKDALTCPNESVLEAGQQAFAAFATSHEDAVSNALPGYVMDKHDFAVQHTLVTWLSMLSKAWDTHLATLLNEDCDLEALERWCQNQSTLRLDALSKDLARMESFLKRQNHDFLSVNKCAEISVWAAMVKTALQKIAWARSS